MQAAVSGKFGELGEKLKGEKLKGDISYSALLPPVQTLLQPLKEV